MEDNENIPAEIIAEAQEATLNLLPVKSRDAYEKVLAEFNDWREKRGVIAITEDVLLAYFLNIKKKFAASSMWTKYSMLKATLKTHKNIDISRYGKLIAYLKSASKTYKPKKAKILEREHIEQFLKEAPDEEYLMMKVALIIGVAGACRCNELKKLNIEDVQDKGSYLYILIPDTKTNISRSFTVMEEGFSVNALDICRKYMHLRPKCYISNGRFFLRYLNEKCTMQAVGINTLSRIPSKIATFLKLKHAETYTGHSMRRSSATLLANAGSDITTIKRHGGWKSSTVAEGYIEESVTNKIEIAKRIQRDASKIENPSVVINPSSNTFCVNVANPQNVTNENKLECDEVNKVMTFNINVNVNFNK